MKILQVGLGNNPGGVESFVMNYFRELAGQDISFDFLCMYDKIAYESEIFCLNGRVIYVPNIKKDYPGYVKKLRSLLEAEKYDVVHVNMLSAANIVPLRLAREAGVKKVISHAHNTSVPGLLRKVMDYYNRSKINNYASVKLACGEAAGRWFFGDSAFEQGEVTVIKNAIDVNKYLFSSETRDAVRRRLGIKDRLLIGHVGRFDKQKNHKFLIRIFREIVRLEPSALLCLIGDGALKKDILEQVQKEHLSQNIIFAGVRPNVEDYLNAMDIFLLPSLFEGLPLTLVEAQTNGLPCVISDSITEESVLLKDRVTRFPLEKTPAEWAEAVLKYRSFQRQEEPGIAERIQDAHFDIKKEADRLIKLYEAQE